MMPPPMTTTRAREGTEVSATCGGYRVRPCVTAYLVGMGSVTVRASGFVPASVDSVAAVLRDLAVQPQWFPGCVSSEVLEMDSHGRPLRARQVNDVKVARDEFELTYEQRPGSMSWVLAAPSTAQKNASGRWSWAEGDGGTAVELELTVEPSIPIPGFMAKKVLGDTAKSAIEGLRNYCSALS